MPPLSNPLVPPSTPNTHMQCILPWLICTCVGKNKNTPHTYIHCCDPAPFILLRSGLVPISQSCSGHECETDAALNGINSTSMFANLGLAALTW